MKKSNRAGTALGRGLARRCPHCGRAPLFEKWFTLHETCAVCGLRFEQRPGDTWALWLIGDRLFLGVLIVLVFLIFRSTSWLLAGAIALLVVVPLIWTMPHRMGVCLAVDYLSRVYWGQAAEIPPPFEGEMTPPERSRPGDGSERFKS
jgi:uncharacterized protein (DUF983 family)